jgi:hypothetical protein
MYPEANRNMPNPAAGSPDSREREIDLSLVNTIQSLNRSYDKLTAILSRVRGPVPQAVSDQKGPSGAGLKYQTNVTMVSSQGVEQLIGNYHLDTPSPIGRSRSGQAGTQGSFSERKCLLTSSASDSSGAGDGGCPGTTHYGSGA